MRDLPPRRNRVRQERLVPPRLAAIGLGALAFFILYGSSGTWAGASSRAAQLPGVSLPDIAQNVLLYVPFGILGTWALRGFRRNTAAVFLTVAALSLVYSSIMELLQMLLASRIASPLDVVSNVAGAAAGVAIATPTEQALGIIVTLMQRAGLTNARTRYLLLALLAAICFVAWYPFDVTLDVSTLSERTRPVRVDPWLRPAAFTLCAHAASFAMLSAITVLSLPKLGRAVSVASVAIGLTILTAVVVDVGQLAMGSQPIGLAAFVSQAAGACGGAALATVFVRGTAYAAE